jgi:hypothetical protein
MWLLMFNVDLPYQTLMDPLIVYENETYRGV